MCEKEVNSLNASGCEYSGFITMVAGIRVRPACLGMPNFCGKQEWIVAMGWKLNEFVMAGLCWRRNVIYDFIILLKAVV